MDSLRELVAYCKEKDFIYLYGAGYYATQLECYLQRQGVDVLGFVVTHQENGKPTTLQGKPIYSANLLQQYGIEKEKMNVILAVKVEKTKKYNEIKGDSLRQTFGSIVFLTEKCFMDLLDFAKQEQLKEKQKKRQEKLIELESKFEKLQDKYKLCKIQKISVWQLWEKESNLPFCYVLEYMGEENNATVRQYCTHEKFQENFGKFQLLPYNDSIGITFDKILQNRKFEMYVVTTHLDTFQKGDIQAGGYIPIQAGCALTDLRKGVLCDNKDQNISEKNRNYCECTALYWIWKNTKNQDYVGLSHYRRLLMLNDSSMEYIKKNDVQIVVGLPHFTISTIKDFFLDRISTYDWDLMKQFVTEADDEYEGIFESYAKGHFYIPCNLCLMQREWFDKYCEFAFTIAEKIEKIYDMKHVCRQDRFMGYIFENLLSLFVMRYGKEINIGYTEIERLVFNK